MAPLCGYLIRELASGAGIGSACWGAIIWANRDTWMQVDAAPLLFGLWGFSTVFAIGYLATSLEFLAESNEDPD